MTLLPALPVIIPFSAAAAAFLLRGSPAVSRAAALAGSAGLLISGLLLMREAASGVPLTLQLGGWPAPFGVAMVADRLSSLLATVTGSNSRERTETMRESPSRRTSIRAELRQVREVVMGGLLG